MTRSTQPHRTRAALAALALTAVVLAGCSSASTGSGDDTASVADAPALDSQAEDVDHDAAAPAADEGVGSGVVVDTASSVPEGRMIARDATVSVAVEDASLAVSRVRAAASAADGYVVSEDLRPGAEDRRGWATVVIAVPSTALDTTLSQLEEIGTVTERGLHSVDVTSSYVDTSSRIETMEASVVRVRGLLDEADTLTDVVSLESELSRREADLDALKARLTSLEGEVSHSSVTVTVREVDDLDAVDDEVEEQRGFLWGLQRGWSAFTTAADAGLTALGATLPFAGAAAVVVGPWWLLRRRQPRDADAPPAPPSP